MAVNLAEKYSGIVNERFQIGTVTNVAFNNDYEWVGVKTLNVYSIETVPITDYTRTGLARYGTPAELQDTVQELTLTQDKSFSFTIDRGNDIDQMFTKGAAQALRRQIDTQVIPALDIYRLAALASEAGNTDTTPATAANAYSLFLDAQEALGNAMVPVPGRIAYMTYAYYNFLKLDPSFVKQGDMSQEMLTTGVMGMVDGVPIIPVPSTYLPANQQFILVHPIAACAPVKLAEYHVHVDPPGISGTLVEGRIYHDAFVLANKVNAIYSSTSA